MELKKLKMEKLKIMKVSYLNIDNEMSNQTL
jgi:hypothetical protein